MDTNIKSFVLLKYEILSNDSNTWHLCEKYPDSVKKKWALRCARDVEHLDKTGKSARCNDLNERYQAGETEVLDELKKAATTYPDSYTAYDACHAAYRAACHAAYAACRAAYTDANAAICAIVAANSREEKWKLYISWLIEELCNYESKQ